MSKSFFSAANWLNRSERIGLAKAPLPLRGDIETIDLIRRWMQLPDKERLESSEHMSAEQSYGLLLYSTRIASLAVRDKNSELILLGVLAACADGWQFDWRDNLVRLAPLYDAAKKIGENPDLIFYRAVDFLAKSAAEGVRAFTLRAPEERSLKTFFMIETTDQNGFRYECIL